MSSSSYDLLKNFDVIFGDGEKLQELSEKLKTDPSPDIQEKATLIDNLLQNLKQFGEIAIEMERNSSDSDSEENKNYQKQLFELIDEMNNIAKKIDPNVKPLKPRYVGQPGKEFFMGDLYRDVYGNVYGGGKSRRRRSHRSRRRNRRSSKKHKKARKSRRANRRHSRKH
jgi:hypothetical protein